MVSTIQTKNSTPEWTEFFQPKKIVVKDARADHDCMEPICGLPSGSKVVRPAPVPCNTWKLHVPEELEPWPVMPSAVVEINETVKLVFGDKHNNKIKR